MYLLIMYGLGVKEKLGVFDSVAAARKWAKDELEYSEDGQKDFVIFGPLLVADKSF